MIDVHHTSNPMILFTPPPIKGQVLGFLFLFIPVSLIEDGNIPKIYALLSKAERYQANKILRVMSTSILFVQQ